MGESVRKHDRVLEIYSRLVAGEIVRKEDLATEYGVNPRSIQRDIDSIREFYSNRATKGGGVAEIRYDHIAKGFRLVNEKTVTLTNAELFAVAKIILESRSLSKEEVQKIIPDLVEACLPTSEKKKMADLVRNELFHYIEPRHGKNMVNIVWELGSAIYHQNIIQMDYKKANNELSSVSIKPVGLMESEYYFYLIAYIGDNDKKHPGYPTIYRVDRIQEYKITNEQFKIPYKDRFEEGEFRKRIPFMYGGPLHKIQFIYKGPDLNAVLDRFPAADCKTQEDGSHLIKTEVYGSIGSDMWLRSQGEYIEFLQ